MRRDDDVQLRVQQGVMVYKASLSTAETAATSDYVKMPVDLLRLKCAFICFAGSRSQLHVISKPQFLIRTQIIERFCYC